MRIRLLSRPLLRPDRRRRHPRRRGARAGRRLPPAFALAAFLLAAWAPAWGGTLILRPGEDLTRTHLEELLNGLLPPPSEGVRRELKVHRPALPLPNTAPGPIRIATADWRHDRRTGRFRLVLTAELLDGSDSSRITVLGELRERVPVPVPRRPLPAGTLVGPGDVETAWLSLSALPEDVVSDARELVGREALRPLWPGRPVRTADLAAPRLVRRGETLTLVLRRPGLEITAVGRALDDGAMGEVVRVMNLDSRRVIRARVSGPREAVPLAAETGS